MPLKLRPTGLGAGIDKDRPDYTVLTGKWEIGRIYQTRGGPRQPAQVLVDDGQRSDDALGSRGDVGRCQDAVSEELGCLEGVGEVGRGAVASGGRASTDSRTPLLRLRLGTRAIASSRTIPLLSLL